MHSTDLQQATPFERRFIRMWKYGYLPSIICNVFDLAPAHFVKELDRLEMVGFDLAKDQDVELLAPEDDLVKDLVLGDIKFYKSTVNSRFINPEHIPYLVLCKPDYVSNIISLIKESPEYKLSPAEIRSTSDHIKTIEARNKSIISDYIDEKETKGIITILATRYDLSRKMVDNILIKEGCKDSRKKKKQQKDEPKATITKLLATETSAVGNSPAETVETPVAETPTEAIETPVETTVAETTVVTYAASHELVSDIQAYLFSSGNIVSETFMWHGDIYKVTDLDSDIAIIQNIKTSEEKILEADDEYQYDIDNAVKYQLNDTFTAGGNNYIVREIGEEIAVVQDVETKEPFFIKKTENTACPIDFDSYTQPVSEAEEEEYFDENEVEITLSKQKQAELINVFMQGEEAGASGLIEFLAKKYNISEAEVDAITANSMF